MCTAACYRWVGDALYLGLLLNSWILFAMVAAKLPVKQIKDSERKIFCHLSIGDDEKWHQPLHV